MLLFQLNLLSDPVDASDEPITLDEVKAYLRVLSADEDDKIEAMIPRARLWVEDYTGVAIVQRQFTEWAVPNTARAIRLQRGPLVGVPVVTYTDSSGVEQTYTTRSEAPRTVLFAALSSVWPLLTCNETFKIVYTAGQIAADLDDRLKGAMYALIEGEFSEGYAYPERATDAAERCCAFLRQMVA